MKRNSHLCFAAFCGLIFPLLLNALLAIAHGQTPNLVVSAGSTGQAPSLSVTSDSNAPWKCFTVSGTGSQYSVVWAESNGTSGGIYFGSIATSTSGPGAVPGVQPPPATDLPIGTLTSSVSAAAAGVDQATAAKMGSTYEALAKGIDNGVIVSPLQLQLATGTQLLASFSSPELVSLSKLTAAVNGWVDAQQCSGKLTPEHMDKYSRTYHAIAAALGTKSAPAAKVGHEREELPQKSPCANGHCPLSDKPQPPAWLNWRRR